jgi:hypothetical protein
MGVVDAANEALLIFNGHYTNDLISKTTSTQQTLNSLSFNRINCAIYCNMTAETWNSSLLGNGGKQFPAEMNTHVTIEELPFLSKGEVNTHLQQYRNC